MTRVAAALSVLTVLLLGAAGVTDDPGVLLTLVGAALWALACRPRRPRGGRAGPGRGRPRPPDPPHHGRRLPAAPPRCRRTSASAGSRTRAPGDLT